MVETIKCKKGDTLIEVILAVGIFSMVAVAVLAVMNGGASSAQLSLEATLAREEVDMQAEALRFIQSSYVAERSKPGSDGKYKELWDEIVSKSNGSSVSTEFSPNECDSLYGREGEARSGFVINTRKLGSFDKDHVGDVVVPFGSEGDPTLIPATTYPRLVYSDDSSVLDNNGESDVVDTAEGIYIVAVRDPGTNIVGGDAPIAPAYYDFYIRTCWYGSGESAPSTIYTLIRLGDPKIGG